MSAATVALKEPVSAAARLAAELPVEQQIAGFLAGTNDGEALFEALYGATVEEPVPQRLLDIVRRA